MDIWREMMKNQLFLTATGDAVGTAVRLVEMVKHEPTLVEIAGDTILFSFASGGPLDPMLKVQVFAFSYELSEWDNEQVVYAFAMDCINSLLDEYLDQFMSGALRESFLDSQKQKDRTPNAKGLTYSTGDRFYFMDGKQTRILEANNAVVCFEGGNPDPKKPNAKPQAMLDRATFEYILRRDSRNRQYTNLLASSVAGKAPSVLHAISNVLLSEPMKQELTSMVEAGQTNADLSDYLAKTIEWRRYEDEICTMVPFRHGVVFGIHCVEYNNTFLLHWHDIAALARGLVQAKWELPQEKAK